MGLEGAVRLGYRKELEAVTDDAEREVLFREMVDRMYEHGKAVSVATHFEIDDVIDPADTRRWIATLFDAVPGDPSRSDRSVRGAPPPEHRHLVTRRGGSVRRQAPQPAARTSVSSVPSYSKTITDEPS